jgi:phenylpropionate dioxygenase-like ring-hydroxylating dioxygenase large terminal subunit
MTLSIDPLLFNDWHPVADAAALAVGSMKAVRLLEHDLIVWRAADGAVHAWDDRCPHRGARLSLGSIQNDRVVCGYHGWQFETSGQCRLQPAHPQDTPPLNACVKRFDAQQAYGLIWVCLGKPRYALLPFPEYDDTRLRTVLCGPYPVASSGPRIVENFIDMAHFSFVHAGILGDAMHTEIPDYVVSAFDDGQGANGMQGVIATACFAYQPTWNVLADSGAMVEYTYRVVRPLSTILTKLAPRENDAADAISLHVQPFDEEHGQAWIVMATTNFASSDDEIRAFQDRIFAQDLDILESQRPKRLPLAPGAEVPQRADRLSAAYRRMLKTLELNYGVI